MEIGDGKGLCKWLAGKQKEKPTLLLKMPKPNWQIKIDFYIWSKLTDDQSANKLFFISIEEYINDALLHSNKLLHIKTVEENWSCMPFYPKHLTIFGFRRTPSLITAVSIKLFKRYQLWRLAVR